MENTLQGYTCQGCGQYIYVSWGPHTCNGRAPQYHNPPIDFTPILTKLDRIIHLLENIEYSTRNR